jgi:hypothetical protein
MTRLQEAAAIAAILGTALTGYQIFRDDSHSVKQPGDGGTPQPSTPQPKAKPVEAREMTVEGPEVSVTADWNQQKSDAGTYIAPPGWGVRQIVVRELSNANGGTYRTEAGGDHARVVVSAHGSGKFFDQYRGWVHIRSSIILQRT